ncbi:SPOR domain-containing protein [Aquabacterium sp. CECT 9606]|uniref:SPOR domain-containing protein n=1 Tax=Aquabacterium sp. CECT 9606 TaxID=2845822 RepID=UPI001E5110A7|nr:SPOR domain-containing protein [Aquabacterium sp. CECT 9606]CAH0356228.1 Endolytic peptidoglycan transglycosylase RlpA [Aquabacterium sp. CECT 9606]
MKSQRGGFFLGMIVGLLIGLAMSLGVAVYITKVPLPFIDKVPQRTAEQDAAEAEHNKNWDPNSGLYGKNPAKPHAVPQPVVDEAASAASEPAVPASGGHPITTDPATPAPAPSKPSAPAKAASSARNPAAILSGEPLSTASAPDSLSYYVQAGAYANQTEAEQQRGKLALMDLEARIVEREVSGRIMYRVRIGPFGLREQAEDVRVKLSANGVDSALVRVQK